MGFDAVIKINTLRELGLPSAGAPDMMPDMLPDDAREMLSEGRTSEDVCTGRVAVRRGNVHITFSEADGVDVEYVFSKDTPGIVTMSRKPKSGEAKLFMVFEQGKRHICVNREDDDGFEIIVCTSVLHNRITSNGTLDIEYAVWLHGIRIERTELHMTVTKM